MEIFVHLGLAGETGPGKAPRNRWVLIDGVETTVQLNGHLVWRVNRSAIGEALTYEYPGIASRLVEVGSETREGAIV